MPFSPELDTPLRPADLAATLPLVLTTGSGLGAKTATFALSSAPHALAVEPSPFPLPSAPLTATATQTRHDNATALRLATQYASARDQLASSTMNSAFGLLGGGGSGGDASVSSVGRSAIHARLATAVAAAEGSDPYSAPIVASVLGLPTPAAIAQLPLPFPPPRLVFVPADALNNSGGSAKSCANAHSAGLSAAACAGLVQGAGGVAGHWEWRQAHPLYRTATAVHSSAPGQLLAAVGVTPLVHWFARVHLSAVQGALWREDAPLPATDTDALLALLTLSPHAAAAAAANGAQSESGSFAAADSVSAEADAVVEKLCQVAFESLSSVLAARATGPAVGAFAAFLWRTWSAVLARRADRRVAHAVAVAAAQLSAQSEALLADARADAAELRVRCAALDVAVRVGDARSAAQRGSLALMHKVDAASAADHARMQLRQAAAVRTAEADTTTARAAAATAGQRAEALAAKAAALEAELGRVRAARDGLARRLVAWRRAVHAYVQSPAGLSPGILRVLAVAPTHQPAGAGDAVVLDGAAAGIAGGLPGGALTAGGPAVDGKITVTISPRKAQPSSALMGAATAMGMTSANSTNAAFSVSGLLPYSASNSQNSGSLSASARAPLPSPSHALAQGAAAATLAAATAPGAPLAPALARLSARELAAAVPSLYEVLRGEWDEEAIIGDGFGVYNTDKATQTVAAPQDPGALWGQLNFGDADSDNNNSNTDFWGQQQAPAAGAKAGSLLLQSPVTVFGDIEDDDRRVLSSRDASARAVASVTAAGSAVANRARGSGVARPPSGHDNHRPNSRQRLSRTSTATGPPTTSASSSNGIPNSNSNPSKPTSRSGARNGATSSPTPGPGPAPVPVFVGSPVKLTVDVNADKAWRSGSARRGRSAGRTHPADANAVAKGRVGSPDGVVAQSVTGSDAGDDSYAIGAAPELVSPRSLASPVSSSSTASAAVAGATAATANLGAGSRNRSNHTRSPSVSSLAAPSSSSAQGHGQGAGFGARPPLSPSLSLSPSARSSTRSVARHSRQSSHHALSHSHAGSLSPRSRAAAGTGAGSNGVAVTAAAAAVAARTFGPMLFGVPDTKPTADATFTADNSDDVKNFAHAPVAVSASASNGTSSGALAAAAGMHDLTVAQAPDGSMWLALPPAATAATVGAAAAALRGASVLDNSSVVSVSMTPADAVSRPTTSGSMRPQQRRQSHVVVNSHVPRSLASFLTPSALHALSAQHMQQHLVHSRAAALTPPALSRLLRTLLRQALGHRDATPAAATLSVAAVRAPPPGTAAAAALVPGRAWGPVRVVAAADAAARRHARHRSICTFNAFAASAPGSPLAAGVANGRGFVPVPAMTAPAGGDSGVLRLATRIVFAPATPAIGEFLPLRYLIVSGGAVLPALRALCEHAAAVATAAANAEAAAEATDGREVMSAALAATLLPRLCARYLDETLSPAAVKAAHSTMYAASPALPGSAAAINAAAGAALASAALARGAPLPPLRSAFAAAAAAEAAAAAAGSAVVGRGGGAVRGMSLQTESYSPSPMSSTTSSSSDLFANAAAAAKVRLPIPVAPPLESLLLSSPPPSAAAHGPRGAAERSWQFFTRLWAALDAPDVVLSNTGSDNSSPKGAGRLPPWGDLPFTASGATSNSTGNATAPREPTLALVLSNAVTGLSLAFSGASTVDADVIHTASMRLARAEMPLQPPGSSSCASSAADAAVATAAGTLVNGVLLRSLWALPSPPTSTRSRPLANGPRAGAPASEAVPESAVPCEAVAMVLVDVFELLDARVHCRWVRRARTHLVEFLALNNAVMNNGNANSNAKTPSLGHSNSRSEEDGGDECEIDDWTEDTVPAAAVSLPWATAFLRAALLPWLVLPADTDVRVHSSPPDSVGDGFGDTVTVAAGVAVVPDRLAAELLSAIATQAATVLRAAVLLLCARPDSSCHSHSDAHNSSSRAPSRGASVSADAFEDSSSTASAWGASAAVDAFVCAVRSHVFPPTFIHDIALATALYAPGRGVEPAAASALAALAASATGDTAAVIAANVAAAEALAGCTGARSGTVTGVSMSGGTAATFAFVNGSARGLFSDTGHFAPVPVSWETLDPPAGPIRGRHADHLKLLGPAAAARTVARSEAFAADPAAGGSEDEGGADAALFDWRNPALHNYNGDDA